MVPRQLLGFAVILIAIVMRLASPATADVSYLVIAGYAAFGRAQAIQALAVSWLMTMLNPAMAAEATAASVGRYAVLAVATASVLLRSGITLRAKRAGGPARMTIVLGVALVAHSLLVSQVADVSVLKALSWTAAALTSLLAWSGLSVIQRDRLMRQVFGGLIAVLLCSLPLLVQPLGYLRNGLGFQGVLAHPQTFGLAMALLGAWAGSRVLASAKPAWGLVAFFGASVVLVVLSESRTAGIAMLLGIMFAGVAGGRLAGRSVLSFMPGLRSRRVHLVVSLSLGFVLLTGSAVFDRLSQFASKRTGSTNLAEAYEASRGALIERMLVNIEAHPMGGIGLGVASYPEDMIVDRDRYLALPTGAPVEKGVMPLAVLEELGVFGLVAVLLWLWMLVRRAAGNGGVTALAVLLTAVLLNLGEYTLFSAGGSGLLILVLIGWAVSDVRSRPRLAAHV